MVIHRGVKQKDNFSFTFRSPQQNTTYFGTFVVFVYHDTEHVRWRAGHFGLEITGQRPVKNVWF